MKSPVDRASLGFFSENHCERCRLSFDLDQSFSTIRIHSGLGNGYIVRLPNRISFEICIETRSAVNVVNPKSVRQLFWPRIFAVCFLLSSFGLQAGSAQDWHQWGGPQRDFSIPDYNFDSATEFASIKEAWHVKIGSGNSGICVHGKIAFVCFTRNNQECVVAYSIADGREIWKRKFDVKTPEFMDLEFGLGPHSTPMIRNDLLFCVGMTGRLSALNVATGATVWERQLWDNGNHTKLERGYAASPIAYEDSIILPVGGKNCSVRCFAMTNGELRWQKHDFDCAYASPLIARLGGRNQAVLLMEQSLIGIDPVTGGLLWSYPVRTELYVNCTSPVIGPDDTIVINTGDGLRGLRIRVANDQYSVEETWASRITICQTTNFVLREGIIYGSKEGSIFAAVDASNGRTVWQSRDLKDCVIAVAGDHLIAMQENGQLVIASVSPRGIKTKWRKPLLSARCWVGPVVAHGLLLVRDSEKLIALHLPKQTE
jgi:outer membrane protein assembly factor BamB